jgi:RsmE family RNA methyltransferase
MDMTALGVAHIILINSYRSQKSYWQSPMLGRLDEFVLEGLQQSVDTIAPSITLEKRFKPFVEDKLPRLLTDIDEQAIVAHPYGALSLSAYLQRASTDSLPKMVFIGSEGGWIDYEIELLAAQGCQALTIGSRILRTEAAVNVIVGQWLLPH